MAPAEDANTLDGPLHAALLADILVSVAHEVAKPSQLVLADTLHATHFVRTGTLPLAAFLDADRTLQQLRAVVVLLRVSATSIRTRTVEGRRGTGFSRYAQKFGADDDALTSYFVGEQERLLSLLRDHSRLPLMVLDGERPTSELAGEIEILARGQGALPSFAS